MALLAMLATAPGGERTRIWLQDRLWGSRGRPQAQQSLRRELTALRSLFPDEDAPMVDADRDRVRLDMRRITLVEEDRGTGAAFLEGFDLPGEEGFEEWLREERQREASDGPAGHGVQTLPESIVNVRLPAPGFEGRPAIAVIPFANATGDPDVEFWADGISDELTDRLARLRWLPVIAPATLAELRDADLDDMAVCAMVGATYVLRGRLQDRGGERQLQVTLVDGRNGLLLWSEQFPLPAGITARVLDELMTMLVGQLDTLIDTRQQAKVLDRRVDELDVEERIWRARWHLGRQRKDDAVLAGQLLDAVLAERPHSAEALIQAAFAKAWDIWSGRRNGEHLAVMRELAQRALAADRFDGRAYMLAGMAEMWARHHDRAETLFKEALGLNPSLAMAHAQLGSCLGLSGRPKEALGALRTALRLSPLDQQVYYVVAEIAMYHLMLEQFEEAVEHANISIARRPGYVYGHCIKINALVRMGRARAASDALAALIYAKPGFEPANVDWVPFADAGWNSYLKEGVEMVARA